MRPSRLRGFLPALALLTVAAGSCADDGTAAPGHQDSCDLPQAGLLGCPPRGSEADAPFSAEMACRRLVDCGSIPEDNVRDDGRHSGDFVDCVTQLERFAPERLTFTLRCIKEATCITLAGGFNNPCMSFGEAQR